VIENRTPTLSLIRNLENSSWFGTQRVREGTTFRFKSGNGNGWLKQNQNSYTQWHAPTVAFSPKEKATLQALGEGTGILVLL
jgi:hypothetical protein